MVHIEQPEAFDLLAQMEGQGWRDTQSARPRDPYGYGFWLQAWASKVAAGLRDVPAPLASFAATHAPLIYGAEGYRRYQVTAEGEIVLDRATVLADAAAKARVLGFRMA